MTQYFQLSIITLVLLLSGCSKLTVENYDKIKTGLTYEEVTAILGSPATCDEVLGLKNCRWGNDTRKIIVNFVGGKVVLTSAENIH